jgi:type IV pilus assembly protein PilQ
MLGAINARFRDWRPLVVFASLTGIVACAASTGLQPEGAIQPGVISEVRVERDGDATVVTLVGLDEPVFTAFAQPDPDRIVVDLASVQPEDLMDPVTVYDGLVDEVALSAFSTGVGDAMTRVEVLLSAPSDFDVATTDEGLVIRVERVDAMSRTGSLEGEDLGTEQGGDPWAINPVQPGAAPADWQAEPATKLTSVEARQVGDGSIVNLVADGSVESAVTFTLEDPARLVIDLPGIRNEVQVTSIEVGSPHARRVRIGQHEEKIRIVIDAGAAANPFEGRRSIPAPGGLVIALGSGEELDWEVANAIRPPAGAGGSGTFDSGEGSAPETASDDSDEEAPADGSGEPGLKLAGLDVTPAEEAGEPPVTIYGVEFDAQEDRDRIVVLGAQPVDYFIYEPDAETLVVSIEGAVIDPDGAVRIAPEPVGPVSLVTAFEQPDVATPEVRVVVKRAPNLKPQVTRRGSLLVIDFPRTGEVAAVPPVMNLPDQVALETGTTPASGAQALPTDGTRAADAGMGNLVTAPAAIAPPTPMAGGSSTPASLEPPAAIEILNEGGLMDGKEYTGRRISLDFKDVEIADVLRLIAEVSDLNVIAGDEVKGRVTIRLVEIPWDQALDVILLTKGLGFMRVGNVLRIAPAQILAQEEEMRLQERRNKEKLEDLVVKLQPVNYANVRDIEKMTKRLLTARGSVNTDTRTNTLIIKDIPSVVDEATALVKAIDTQTPQVMIEAKIVEASLDFSREFGSVWSIGSQPLVDPFDPASGARTDLGGKHFRLHEGAAGNNAIFGNPITAGANSLVNLAAFILDEKVNLDLQLQAAEVNGDGKVISSPRVVTLDNSKAQIEQGVSIPFQTFENGDAQLEFVDAVLKLNVTPHITADKSIIMDIEVSRNAPDDSVFTLTGSPAIAKNQVETETLVKDGQTLVLGGIYVVDKSKRQSRVPYIHKIPILGHAFRSDEISESRKELLIFVTPRIVVTQPAAS